MCKRTQTTLITWCCHAIWHTFTQEECTKWWNNSPYVIAKNMRKWWIYIQRSVCINLLIVVRRMCLLQNKQQPADSLKGGDTYTWTPAWTAFGGIDYMYTWTFVWIDTWTGNNSSLRILQDGGKRFWDWTLSDILVIPNSETLLQLQTCLTAMVCLKSCTHKVGTSSNLLNSSDT